jgi:hypothetical protein
MQDLHGDDVPSFKPRPEFANDRFYFRQLRHLHPVT